MSNVLLVDSDHTSAVLIQKGLAAASHTVTVAPTGAFALTALEWEAPDIIVSKVDVGDMDGYELCEILKSDAKTKGIPFVLLTASDVTPPGASNPSGVDAVLSGNLEVSRLVMCVKTILRPDSSARNGSEPGALREQRPEVTECGLQGSLAALDIAEVIQLLTNGRKSGRLTISIGAGEGLLVLERGRLVHAEFSGLTGEPALGALLSTSRAEAGGHFRFEPRVHGGTGDVPHTIEKSVSQLLLGVETDDAGPSPTPCTAPSHGVDEFLHDVLSSDSHTIGVNGGAAQPQDSVPDARGDGKPPDSATCPSPALESASEAPADNDRTAVTSPANDADPVYLPNALGVLGVKLPERTELSPRWKEFLKQTPPSPFLKRENGN